MRKPRSFRPTADPLESRMVPSSVTVAMRAAHLGSFHPRLQLHTPFARTFAGTVAGLTGASISSTRTAAPRTGLNIGSNALLAGRNGPIGNGLQSTLLDNVATTRTSTGVTTASNSRGAFGGLAFNSPPGTITGLTFNSAPGAITGLTTAGTTVVSGGLVSNPFTTTGINGVTINTGTGTVRF